MSEGIVTGRIAKLVSLAQLQEQMKKLCTHSQAFLAVIVVVIDKIDLTMEHFQTLDDCRQIRFNSETLQGLLDPKRRFCRSLWRDTQWYDILPRKSQRREIFEPRYSSTKPTTQLIPFGRTNQGNALEEIQVLPSGYPKSILVACDL